MIEHISRENDHNLTDFWIFRSLIEPDFDLPNRSRDSTGSNQNYQWSKKSFSQILTEISAEFKLKIKISNYLDLRISQLMYSFLLISPILTILHII